MIIDELILLPGLMVSIWFVIHENLLNVRCGNIAYLMAVFRTHAALVIDVFSICRFFYY